MAKEMTLADHAEAWWQEQGRNVPPRGSDDYQQMYENWATWAFADLRGKQEKYRPRKRGKRS